MAFPAETLKPLLLKLRNCSPFYRQHFAASSVNWEQLDNYEEFRLLPYLEVPDVRLHSAQFRCPETHVVRVVGSGGTLGKPKSFFNTVEDWEEDIQGMGRSLADTGIGPQDVVLILQPFGLWIYGTLAIEGLIRLGALAVPLGVYMSDEDIRIALEEYQATVIMATPANLCRMTAEFLKQDPALLQRVRVRKLILGGEKFSEQQRHYLNTHWKAESYGQYGSAELASLGCECLACHSYRLRTENHLFEIVTGEGAQILAPGMTGELVATTLHKQGTPLIRYRTGDILQVVPGCPSCNPAGPNIHVVGRTTATISLMDSTKLYGYQIEEAIRLATPIPCQCQVILNDQNGKDALHFVVYCERYEPGMEEPIRANLLKASLDFSDAFKAGAIASLTVECKDMTEVETGRTGKLVTFKDLRGREMKG